MKRLLLTLLAALTFCSVAFAQQLVSPDFGPIYIAMPLTGSAAPASAAATATQAIGLATNAAFTPGVPVRLQKGGFIELDDWTQVTGGPTLGSKRLTLGATYYLSVTPGMLTSTAPSSPNIVQQIGVAQSANTLAIEMTLGSTLPTPSADRALDNLTSPTALNQHLLPGGAFNLGSSSAKWANAWFSGTITAAAFAGPITSTTLTGTVATGTPPLAVTSTTPVANLTSAPLIYDHSGTQIVNGHQVVDVVTLSGGTATVTLSGAAIFTSSSSYRCTATDETSLAPVGITQTSGTAVTFSGTTNDVISYSCSGN